MEQVEFLVMVAGDGACDSGDNNNCAGVLSGPLFVIIISSAPPLDDDSALTLNDLVVASRGGGSTSMRDVFVSST